MDLAKMICERYDKMKADRSTWEREWQDIVQLVRPGGSDFTRGQAAGQSRNEDIFDSTAPEANDELASGLHSYLTPPTDEWFGISVNEKRDVENNYEVKLWLDEVKSIMMKHIGSSKSGFTMAIHENYLDIGAFGTAILSQEVNREKKTVIFRSFPLASCFIDENSDGFVDTLYRCIKWTRRQCAQYFGEDKIPKKIREEKNDDKEFMIIHAVFPRTDRNPKLSNQKNMSFASVWVSYDTKEFIKESGYKSFPYQCGRWSKLSNERYGRSPAKNCLPDIRMINAMEKVLIRASQKAVDPPLVLPSDGVMLPVRTSPNSIIFKEPGSDPIEPLTFQGNLPVGFEHAEQKRQSIRRAFYNDELKLGKEKIEMSATEVVDRREEKLRAMAPMLGRIMTEVLEPLIVREYELLGELGWIPPAPAALAGKTLKITFTSAAAIAQLGVRAQSISRYVAELAPIAQISPEVMDAVDTDAVARELAYSRGTPMSIIRSPEQIAQIRQARQQQEQIQQAAAVAEPLTKSMKNLNDAGISV
jgi:hypothetical protein